MPATRSAGAISGPIVGLIAAAYSWRISFLAVTVIGLVWLLFWWWLVTDTPAQNPRVGHAERDLVSQSRAETVTAEADATPISQWLLSPTVLAIALAFFSYNYVLYFFLTWLPSYLTDVHHLAIKQMSIITVIPWLFGSLGMVSGGMLSDFLYRRTGNPVLARKIVLVGALACAAVLVTLVTQVESLEAAIALIAGANLFLLMVPPNCWGLIQETVPSRRVGSVGGYVHSLSNIAGIIGPAVTGFIVQYGGGYGVSFALAGLMVIIASVCVLLVVRSGRGAAG